MSPGDTGPRTKGSKQTNKRAIKQANKFVCSGDASRNKESIVEMSQGIYKSHQQKDRNLSVRDTRPLFGAGPSIH